jgi:hypothetical protein
MAKRRSAAEGQSTPRRAPRGQAKSIGDVPGTDKNESTRAPTDIPAGESKQQPDRGPSALSEVEFHARVARRAYDLFEQRGRNSGGEVEDWLEAERLVREELLREEGSR